MTRPRPSPLPWYWDALPDPPRRPALHGATRADVAIVGAGLAGVSAALELSGRGLDVVVLEADRVGWGASGRSGAQVLPGVAASQAKLVELVGEADARRIWDITVEGVDLVRERIAAHGIDCDWSSGQIHVALKGRQVRELAAWQAELERVQRYPVTLLDRDALRAEVRSDRYLAGLKDTRSGHLQPLAYLRGLAAAAEAAGASIHEDSRVTGWHGGNPARLETRAGTVTADHVLFAGNAALGALAPALSRRIMAVRTYVVATEPLGEARAAALLPANAAVTDMNWVLDYFRRSADHRLLFGGRVSYSGADAFATAESTRRRMLRVFPQLEGVRLTHAWGGDVDITLNRAPDFNRLAPNVWYLQGFSGHGMALTGIAGRIAAEAIAGSAGRFDLFARIPHREFPGGPWLGRPALVLAMLWYRLRDLL